MLPDHDVISRKRTTLRLQAKEAHRGAFSELGGKHIFKYLFQLGDHIDSLYIGLDELPKRVEHLEKKVSVLLKKLEKKEPVQKKKRKGRVKKSS